MRAGAPIPGIGGGSTNRATMRRAMGRTTTIVGNATAHDNSQALNQRPCQPALSPTAVSVEIPDTTMVINMLNTSGMAIAL